MAEHTQNIHLLSPYVIKAVTSGLLSEACAGQTLFLKSKQMALSEEEEPLLSCLLLTLRFYWPALQQESQKWKTRATTNLLCPMVYQALLNFYRDQISGISGTILQGKIAH